MSIEYNSAVKGLRMIPVYLLGIYWITIYNFFLFLSTRSDEESDYEISDQDVNKLLIVTQSPPSAAGQSTSGQGQTTSRPPKHGGYDRTGDWITRTKMTQELAKVINDGLYYYEQDLWEDNEWVCMLMALLKFNSCTVMRLHQILLNLW